jgi:sugar phosphate isomerase/epimerase
MFAPNRKRKRKIVKYCLNKSTAGRGLEFPQFVAFAASVGFDGADLDIAWAQTHGAPAAADVYASNRQVPGGWSPPVDWRGDAAKQSDGLAALQKAAAIAATLKADSCATWLMPSSPLPFIENWNFHVARLQPVAQILADHGLRLGLEFVAPYHLRRKFPHEFIFTPGLMLELADAIGPNVGLLVDVFHCHCAGTTWEHLATIPAARIVLVHINDAPATPVAMVEDGKRALPGDGIIDLRGFVKAMDTAGYTGPASMEVFSEDLGKLPREEAGRRAGASLGKMR